MKPAERLLESFSEAKVMDASAFKMVLLGTRDAQSDLTGAIQSEIKGQVHQLKTWIDKLKQAKLSKTNKKLDAEKADVLKSAEKRLRRFT